MASRFHAQCHPRGERCGGLRCGFVLLALFVGLLGGCGKEGPTPQTVEGTGEAVTPTAPARRVSDEPGAVTIADLREQLGIGDAGTIRKVGGRIVGMDLRGTGVSDLSALKGLPLRELYLEETPVADIAALAGMPLDKLYLSHTQVADLTPLAGMRLTELNLVGTPLTDITPMREVGFATLWIPETDVSDLSPLAGKSFVSLDVHQTPVSDLSPLSGNQSLRRLHIAETKVTDLTPLAGLKLERLIFTPGNIDRGLNVIRNMPTLKALDIQFDGVAPVKTPEEFWQAYDAGVLNGSSE